MRVLACGYEMGRGRAKSPESRSQAKALDIQVTRLSRSNVDRPYCLMRHVDVCVCESVRGMGGMWMVAAGGLPAHPFNPLEAGSGRAPHLEG